MKKHEIERGATYLAKVSGKVVPVRIVGPHPHGGWWAVNTLTNRDIHIRTGGRLRGLAPEEK